MNAAIKNLSYDQVIFFDLEMASGQKQLDPKSELFKIFQYKKRNRETDELPDIKETQRLYKKDAALDPITGRVVSGTVGYVKNDEIHLKSFFGEEKEVVQGVVDTLANSKRIISGFNIVGYDLPYIRKRATILGIPYPNQINDVGQKPWIFADKVFDIMDQWKGTGFYYNNLDEMCWAFGVPSPKNGDVKGSEVSKVFWEGGIDKIVTYNESDVRSTINLFRVLKGDKIIE